MPTFISYNFQDETVYSTLCLALDAAGVVRWDSQSMTLGDSLANQLQQAIRSCEVCVFLATRRSIASPWCLAERGAFWGAGKKVLLFMVDPDLAESTLPPQFKGTLRVDTASRLIEALKKANDEYNLEQNLAKLDPKFFASSAEYGSEKDWESLLQETTHHFDLLGLTLDQWRRTNKFREKVLAKAEAGCKVRCLLMHQDNPLLKGLFQEKDLDSVRRGIEDSFGDLSKLQTAHENIAVRQIWSGISYCSLTRSDRHVVITQYLSSTDWGYGPTWRCEPGSPLFNAAMNEFEHLWTDCGAPVGRRPNNSLQSDRDPLRGPGD